MLTVLVLGGTHEAAELARALAAECCSRVITSLAGRTQQPAPLPGEVRRGGFGGADGLREYLYTADIGAVIDATHPFASTISCHAVAACAAAGVPLLRLERLAWTPQPGDQWLTVADAPAAAAALAPLGQRVLLTLGHTGLAEFAPLREKMFWVRLIEPPPEPLPLAHYHLLLQRGPFGEQAEIALLRHYDIAVVVSKNSGGAASYGKIAAARGLGIPVVMIERPLAAGTIQVTSVAAAQRWLHNLYS